MKGVYVAAVMAALTGVDAASDKMIGNHRNGRHNHRAIDKFLKQRNEADKACVTGCNTYWTTVTGEPTLVYQQPTTTTTSTGTTTTTAVVTDEYANSVTEVVLPTPASYSCPTPGIYTFPATSIVVGQHTTVCGATSTHVPPGTHTVGGYTTAVEAPTVVTCPVATVSTSGTQTISTIVQTTYSCPTPGTYTICPITTTVTESTQIVYPIPTSYAPGTYVAPQNVVTVTENDYVTYCPFSTTGFSATTPAYETTSSVYYPAPTPASSSSVYYPAPSVSETSSSVYYPAPVESTSSVYSSVAPIPQPSSSVYYPAPVSESSSSVYSTYSPVSATSSSVYYPAPISESSSSAYSTYSPASATSSSVYYQTPTPVSSSYASSVAPVSQTGSSVSSAYPQSTPGAPSGGLTGTCDHYGITYTPYEASSGNCKSADEVDSDIAAIQKAGFQVVRVYSTDCNTLENVGSACKKYGLQIIIGIFIKAGGCSYSSPDIKEQVDAIAAWAQWDLVKLMVVGNEAIMNGFCSATELSALITAVKGQCGGYKGLYTVSETLNIWQQSDVSSAICGVVDVVGANIHAYFNAQVTASSAGDFVSSQLALLANICPGHDVINLESGWPKNGTCNGSACPGTTEQSTALQSIREKCGSKTVFFSFDDDMWKAPGPFGCEQSWGVANAFSISASVSV